MVLPTEWIRALAGGVLIGASASMLLVFNGRIAGVSGVVAGVATPRPADVDWRALFVGGLMLGALVARLALGDAFSSAGTSLGTAVMAGLLVGVGSRLGNGCTSGHGVCGVARLSPRSIAATVTFIGTGALTVLAARVAR